MADYESDLERENKALRREIDLFRGNLIALTIILAHIPETKFIDRNSVEGCLKLVWDGANNNENFKRGSLEIVEHLFEISRFIT